MPGNNTGKGGGEQGRHPQPEHRGFELPASLWMGMLGCYAIFFIAITLATGGSGAARFAIIISVLYTMMFFSVSSIISALGGEQPPSPVERTGWLQTWCGPMESRSVYAQILIVPLALVVFGLGMLVVIKVFG